MAATTNQTEQRSVPRLIYGVLALITFIGILVQVFLAGSGIFVNYSRFDMHEMLGYLLIIASILLLISAFVARLPRQLKGQTFGLLVMMILQIVFVELRDTGLKELAALHVLNAFGIFGNSLDLARKSVGMMRGQ